MKNELVDVEHLIFRAKRENVRLERKKRRTTIQQWIQEFDAAWEKSKVELEDLMTLKAFIQLTK
jgi:hypothetical protein